MALAIRSTITFLGSCAAAGIILGGCSSSNNEDQTNFTTGGKTGNTGGAVTTGGKANVGGGGSSTGGAATGGSKVSTGGSVAAGGTSAATGGTKATGGTTAAVGGTTAAVGGTVAVGGTAAVGGTTAVGTTGTSAPLCELDNGNVDPLYGTSIFCQPTSTNLSTLTGHVAIGSITLSASAGTMTLTGNVTAAQANTPLSLQSPYTDCSADAGPNAYYGLDATDSTSNKLFTGLTITVTNNSATADTTLNLYLPDLVTSNGKTYFVLASVSVAVAHGATVTRTLHWSDVTMHQSDGTTVCVPDEGAFDPTHILGVGPGFAASGPVNLTVTGITFSTT